MGDFFHGWRRKIGVMTLLMALVCLALWVRGSIVLAHLPVVESIEYASQMTENRLVIKLCAELALVSAYLLLVKPRPKATTKST